jgi:hypothetical protein
LNGCFQRKKIKEPESRPEGPGLGTDRGSGTEHEVSVTEETSGGHDVLMNKPDERATSFFSQPGILAGICLRSMII